MGVDKNMRGIVLAGGQAMPLHSLFSATMIGFMTNNLLPFRLGEFVRPWVLARRERCSTSMALATIVVERVVDMLALLAILGMTLLVHPIRPGSEAARLTQAGAGTLIALTLGLTVLLVTVERMPGPSHRLIRWLGRRLPGGHGERVTRMSFTSRETAGSLVIDKVDVGTLNERQRTLFRLNRLGYVFQDYALVPELTAEENIYLPSKVRGMTVKECTRACRDILGLVGLRDRVSFLPGELSGGEQQRVAIARALINNPAIILADEPCANLDTRNSTIILELIRKLNRELRQTVVMVSHEEWHRKYFDRVIARCKPESRDPLTRP